MCTRNQWRGAHRSRREHGPARGDTSLRLPAFARVSDAAHTIIGEYR
ncbi:hypothetical protein DFR70_101102 [Nocardia tenerifensis]|uniref:Uncharacterized protein n=1 Tax=Nocardia tenerifensis TaxID=228006 RepID=A0A318KEN7_9NOCA|nr:hypothetical protein DFR70_101102 [Nocardia tenerifensis]